IAMVLDWRQLGGRSLLYTAAASAAGYIVLAGALWSLRRPLKNIGLRLGMSPFSIDDERIVPWLGAVCLAIGALIIGVEFWVVLNFENPTLRVGGSLATLALAGGLSLLATTRTRDLLRLAALSVGPIALVQFGWSLMDPLGSVAHEELPRAIRMMA